MNKYAARGLINEALTNGKQVVVISHTGKGSSIAFDEVAHVVEQMKLGELFGVKTYRANGNQRILCGVGTIRFLPIRANGRGFMADIVFIDNEADRAAFDLDIDRMHAFHADVRAMTATGGEVIRS